MSVWAFASSFSERLGLTRFPAADLCTCLQREGEPTLLIELCMTLLRTLLRSTDEKEGSLRAAQLPPPSEAALVLQQLPPADLVTPTTWAEVLRSVGWLLPDFAPPELQDACRDALSAMQRGGFASLGVAGRLALLRGLCDACLQATPLQEALREAEGARLELQTEHNAQRRELLAKQGQAPPKEEGVKGGSRILSCAAPLPLADPKPPASDGEAKGEAKGEAEAEAKGKAEGEAEGEAKGEAKGEAEEVVKDEQDGKESDEGNEAAKEGDGAGGDGVAAAAPPRKPISGAAAEEFKAARKAAADALLAAIEARSTAALAAAIEGAEGAGHEGVTPSVTTVNAEGESVVTAGTPWATDELRHARAVLAEQLWSDGRVDELREAKLSMLRSQANERAAQPVYAADVLGLDGRKRRYYAFPHDPSRVWVEATATDDSWRWAFYASRRKLSALVASLDGRPSADGGADAEMRLKRT
eukprot:793975-Prymnesium_polylepis.1